MAKPARWHVGTVVEVCARRAFIRTDDFPQEVRITLLSQILTRNGSCQPIREVSNDISDYFCIGDKVQFQSQKRGHITATVAKLLERSKTPFLETNGKVHSLGAAGLVWVNFEGRMKQLHFRDQNCATPHAETLSDWFYTDCPTLVKLYPSSKDPKRILISIRPIYEAYGNISRVIALKNSVYAKSPEGDIFLPFSKFDAKKPELMNAIEKKKQKVHFWAYPNYEDQSTVSPWLAYRWHFESDCSTNDDTKAENKQELTNKTDKMPAAKKEHAVEQGEEETTFLETGVQTEQTFYYRSDVAEEYLTPLRLPKIFQQNQEPNSNNIVDTKNEAVAFVKEFEIIMITDKKIYDHLKNNHGEFLNEALKLATKCSNLLNKQ